MDNNKLHFISTASIPLLQKVAATETGNWGKMNGQQMGEHVAAFFKVSNNQLHFPVFTPEDMRPKAFLLSNKDLSLFLL